MTKQQLREAIRRVIQQELNEGMKTKTVPNPNAGKWRIVTADKKETPLTKEFYGTKAEAEEEAERRDDAELAALKEAWGQQGSKLTQGGAKIVKELEKEQKSRTTRMVRDYLDRALLDIATLFRDVLLVQSNSLDSLINTDLLSEITNIANNSTQQATLRKLEAIMSARTNLSHNAAPLLTIEALMVSLK